MNINQFGAKKRDDRKSVEEFPCFRGTHSFLIILLCFYSIALCIIEYPKIPYPCFNQIDFKKWGNRNIKDI